MISQIKQIKNFVKKRWKLLLLIAAVAAAVVAYYFIKIKKKQ
jgi:capsular polysaccharide biosynthesis protein